MRPPRRGRRLRVAFVYLFCPHYRIRTFERLAELADVDFYFFSAGTEWFWLPQHGLHRGDFRSRYLRGFEVLGTRVTPTLPLHVLAGGYDVVIKCLNGRFALPATMAAARLAGSAFVLFTEVWHRLGTTFHQVMHPVTRAIYRGADAVAAVGSHVAAFLEEEGVDREAIVSLRYATDNAFYGAPVADADVAALRASWGLPPDGPVVLYLGRLAPEKGLGVLLDAFDRLAVPGASLVVAGAGSEDAALRRQARGLRRSCDLYLPGYLDWRQAPVAYALADVVVVPSLTTPRFKEPWGLTVNEAMLQGVPVVCSDSVGAAAGGLLRDGREGLVVPEGSVSALAGALDAILGDPTRGRAMGRAAALRVQSWDDEALVDGFLQAAELGVRRRHGVRGGIR